MATVIKPASNAALPWHLRLLQRAKAVRVAPAIDAQSGVMLAGTADDKLAAADSQSEQPAFLPRFHRTPNGRDWS